MGTSHLFAIGIFESRKKEAIFIYFFASSLDVLVWSHQFYKLKLLGKLVVQLLLQL